MINRKLHIVLLMLLSVLLFTGMYLFFRASLLDFVQVNISAKALKNAETQLLYSDASLSDTTRIKSERNTILGWQFYKNYTYCLYDIGDVKEMTLLLGEDSNSIFIDKISYVQFANGRHDTLFEWSPDDSLNAAFVVFKNATPVSHTARNIQINTDKDGARVHLNFQEVLKNYKPKSVWLHELKSIVASLLLTFFILLTIIKAPSLLSRMSFRLTFSKNFLLVYTFFTLLFFIFLNSIFKWVPDMKSRENRALTQLPEISAKNFFLYPEQFSSYADEHYAFRNSSYYVNSVLHAKLVNESVLPQNVIMGKRRWLYYNEDGSLNDVRRLTKIDSAEINNVISITQNRLAWLNSRNIKYYIIVPPNKERIYPEFLPDAYFPVPNYGHNRLDYYKKMLREHTNVVFIDPTDSLYVAKLRKDVYYHSDTHWNLYGGFIGYLCLMNEVVKDFPFIKLLKEDDFHITESFNAEGDLSSMLALQNVYKRKEYLFTFKDSSRKLMPNLPTKIVLHYNDNKTLDSSQLKLLMFRDSYANYLIPFINLHFREATYIWNYEFMSDMIERQKPDVIIFESLERFMSYALTIPNSPAMDAEVAEAYLRDNGTGNK